MTKTARMTEDEVLKLLRLIQNHDNDASTKLYSNYSRLIWSVLYRIVGPNHIDDCAQEFWLKMFFSGAIGKFKPNSGTPFAAWLVVVARNHALDTLPRLRDHVNIALLVGTMRSNDISPEARAVLNDCLSQLPPEEYIVIAHRREGDVLTEIAKHLRWAVGTAWAYEKRAKQRLEDCLGRKGGKEQRA